MLEYKGYEYKIEDLSEKGDVKFVTSVSGNIDYGDDLIADGAYKNTVNSIEDKDRLKHYREHNSTRLVGFPVLSIEGSKLWAKSSLILGTKDGSETYELYKAALKAGRSMEHSIGYGARSYHYEEIDSKQVRVIDDIYIAEVSTLSALGMNPLANEFDVKSMDFQKLLIEEKYLKQLLNAKFDDVKLEGLEQLKNKIEKELIKRQPQEKSLYEILLNTQL